MIPWGLKWRPIAMRLFQRFGILLGSLHIVLYFLVPDYLSMLDKVAPPVIGLPVMFLCGYEWPLLVFFAFAPRRFQEEPDAQEYILRTGRVFGVRSGRSLRVVSLILLWPFTLGNFAFPYLLPKIMSWM
jgi:hypothetical protein